MLMSVETSQSTKTWEERQRKGQRPTRPPGNNKKSDVCAGSSWRRSAEAYGRSARSSCQHGCTFWLRVSWDPLHLAEDLDLPEQCPNKTCTTVYKYPSSPRQKPQTQKSSLTEQGRNAKPKLNWWFIDVRHVLKRNSCLMIIMPPWGA